MPDYLLVDVDHPASRPLCRFQSMFQYRDGIFSPLERLILNHSEIGETNTELVYFHFDSKLEAIYSKQIGATPFREKHADFRIEEFKLNEFGDISSNSEFKSMLQQYYQNRIEWSNNPTELLSSISSQIKKDTDLIQKANFQSVQSDIVMGDSNLVFIHSSIKLPPGIIFNTLNGPIVIDADCKFTPFSYIEGPFYAAPGCYLDNVRITGGTILGKGCRVSGEIENSIFGNFSNKHHEGFVGHSVIGNWVNLGALTTTSDLKNNYGHVRLQLPTDQFPSRASSFFVYDTQTIKFGSILGDCVKTAIGTLLNTGTVIDAGCNVFGGAPHAYVPPLSWGNSGHVYRPARFIEDCQKIYARRGQSIPPDFEMIVNRLAQQK